MEVKFYLIKFVAAVNKVTLHRRSRWLRLMFVYFWGWILILVGLLNIPIMIGLPGRITFDNVSSMIVSTTLGIFLLRQMAQDNLSGRELIWKRVTFYQNVDDPDDYHLEKHGPELVQVVLTTFIKIKKRTVYPALVRVRRANGDYAWARAEDLYVPVSRQDSVV